MPQQDEQIGSVKYMIFKGLAEAATTCSVVADGESGISQSPDSISHRSGLLFVVLILDVLVGCNIPAFNGNQKYFNVHLRG
jgi:hypothetical protein